jgi:hypothetical protein
MSEERTEPPPAITNQRMIDNAKKISQYMREQLEELKEMLRREPPIEKVEDMLRAAGDRIDPPNQTTDKIFGVPITARVPYMPGGNPFAKGRTPEDPAPYEDPLEDRDVLEDILDADVVVVMKAPPQDQVDIEIHVESCPTCQVNYYKLCAHCLELKLCTDVPFQLSTPAYHADEMPDQEGPPFGRLQLCRECKRDAHNTGGLVLEE